MIIQRLSADDWVRFRCIRMEALRDSPDAFGSTLEEAAARSEEDWREQLDALATFVAVVDGSDAGTARGSPHDVDATSAFLISMWVAPNFRGSGIGQELIQSVIAWARSEGYSKLALDVADENERALNLYARAGFEPTGETGSLPYPRRHVREHRRELIL